MLQLAIFDSQPPKANRQKPTANCQKPTANRLVNIFLKNNQLFL